MDPVTHALIGATTSYVLFGRRLGRTAAGIGALLVAVGVMSYLGLGARGCSSRDDVTARVATVSSGLQQAAAQGKITVERLADGIKRLNAAATAYEGTQDHQAYCSALDALSGELGANGPN